MARCISRYLCPCGWSACYARVTVSELFSVPSSANSTFCSPPCRSHLRAMYLLHFCLCLSGLTSLMNVILLLVQLRNPNVCGHVQRWIGVRFDKEGYVKRSQMARCISRYFCPCGWSAFNARVTVSELFSVTSSATSTAAMEILWLVRIRLSCKLFEMHRLLVLFRCCYSAVPLLSFLLWLVRLELPCNSLWIVQLPRPPSALMFLFDFVVGPIAIIV